jgi:hypothetical protein
VPATTEVDSILAERIGRGYFAKGRRAMATKRTANVEGRAHIVPASIAMHLRSVYRLEEATPEHILRLVRELDRKDREGFEREDPHRVR